VEAPAGEAGVPLQYKYFCTIVRILDAPEIFGVYSKLGASGRVGTGGATDWKLESAADPIARNLRQMWL
jgi:hypothetical protein